MKVGLFDLEANGFLEHATRVHCAVVKIKGGPSRKFRPTEIYELLRYLETFDVLIAHNGIGYDFPILKKLYDWEFTGKIVDTLVMSRLLNPNRLVPFNCLNKKAGPHSIEAWGYRVGRGKPEHNDWENFSEDMLHRCSEDTEILELVYDALLEEAKGKHKWREAFLLSFDLFKNLHEQEVYGWKVDVPLMHKNVRMLTKWIERIDRVITPRLPNILEVEETKKNGEYNYIHKPFLKSGKHSQSVLDWYARTGLSPELYPVVGSFSRINYRKVNLNSNEETKEFLLQQGWEPLEWNTNDDGERTSPKISKDDPFEGLEGKLGKFVAKRIQCRQRRGIVEGLLALVRPDGRIGSRVNTIAVTGRATHRNIVNIPKASSFFGKWMRAMFTSSDGFVLVGTDSDSCQLRMLAGRMNNPVYTEAICNGDKSKGTDSHSLTRDIGELESRDIAKNVMYCLLFGGGDGKLAKTAKKPAGSGAALRDRLYRGLDGLGTLMESLQAEWRATAKQRWNPKFNRMEYYDGLITGLDGRPIKVSSEHQLLVYLLQSDEAIMMTKAYNLLCARLHEKYVWGKDYGVVCWYHDEFTIECREEIAEDVKKLSEQCIVDAGAYYKISCPHVGDGKIGKNWNAIH